MTKVIENLMNEIYKMDFPSFYVYEFGSNDKELVPMNRLSRNFLWALAIDLHSNANKESLGNMIRSAASYAYWSKCEYEHWNKDMVKIGKDGYYEQFIKWAYDSDEYNWFENFPTKLHEFLENHPLTTLYEREKKRINKLIEKKKGKDK